MTSRVILQPCANPDALKHYVDTIQNPVDINRIKPFLSTTQLSELIDVFEGRTNIPVWGVTAGKGDANVAKWSRIESGDVTFFSGDGRIFSSATVVAKIHNKSLALDLWNTDTSGQTWEYVYFLDEVTEQKIQYQAFNEVVGYKPNFVIQGFNILDEEKSNLLLNAFDLRSTVYFPDIPVQDYYTAVTFLDDASSLDSVVMGKGRIEQLFLRNTLFGKRSAAKCCLCGRLLPVNLLWAAHIKKRAACSLDEKKDFKHIVAPMCKLGCDELYERSYLSINSSGYIVRSSMSVSSPDLNIFLDSLVGKQCQNWNENNKKYYAWHHNQSGIKDIDDFLKENFIHFNLAQVEEYPVATQNDRYFSFMTIGRIGQSNKGGTSNKLKNITLDLNRLLEALASVFVLVSGLNLGSKPMFILATGLLMWKDLKNISVVNLGVSDASIIYTLFSLSKGKSPVDKGDLYKELNIQLVKNNSNQMGKQDFDDSLAKLISIKAISQNGSEIKLIERVTFKNALG